MHVSILPSKGHLQPGRFHCCFFQCIKGCQECPQGILPTVCCRSRDIMNHLLSCSADDQNSRALELVEEFIWKLSTATLFFHHFWKAKQKQSSICHPGIRGFPGLSGDPFMDPWPFGTVKSTALKFWRPGQASADASHLKPGKGMLAKMSRCLSQEVETQG